jgi:shikimate dehydrogenase
LIPIRLGLLGHGIAGSLSPRLHAAAARACGLDIEYRLIDVAPSALDATLARLMGELRGFNVTRPYKEAVATRLHRLAPEAAALGAVNTVVVGPDGPEGHDTDVAGFAAALGPLPGPVAVVVGAGGAARAVVSVLVRAGARRIDVLNRHPARAERLVADLAAGVGVPGGLDQLASRLRDAALLVQCTPADVPLPLEALPPGTPVHDLRYGPATAALRREAEARGLPYQDGLPMLVEQGRAAFALWTGRLPPADPLRRALD